MNDAKYSILFMRDDLDVRRYRLNPFWLKSLAILLALMVVIATAGIYFGATSLLENLQLNSENKELSRRLEEAELRLTTLGNMEKILESYDTRELQSLLGAEKSDAPDTVVAETTAAVPVETKPPVDLTSIFSKTDTGAVRLEEMSLRIESNAVLLSFNLINNLDNIQLTGESKLALVTNDGQLIEIKSKNADLSFQIQRRKPIRAKVPLPEGLNRGDVFGLRLTVMREDGKVVFSETFPHPVD